MNLDALGRLVWEKRRPARGLDPGHAAVMHLPEVCDGLPALVPVESGWAVYSACGPSIQGPLRLAFERALREAEGPAGAGAFDGDDLSAVVTDLVAEAVMVSPGAGVVPLLEVVRQVTALLSAPPPDLAVRVAAIRAMPPEEQGAFLGRLAGRIQVRLSVALARLGTAGVRIPALAQAVTGSRFAMLFERGALDIEASLPLLAAVHEQGIPPATVSAGAVALRTAITGVIERRNAGRGTPDDLGFVLRHIPPDLAERGGADAARALLLDPDALAWVLPQLARFTDAKALVRAGVPQPIARDLVKPEHGLALASALGEVLKELRRWDVISALAAAIAPVADVDGRADRALVVPHAPVHAVVVAVGLGRVRQRGAADGRQVERIWAEAMESAPGAIHADLGHCALVVFLDALAAFRFALRLGSRFGSAPPAVGVGVGEITGGTDGEVVRLGGPAVETALQWLSLSPLPSRTGWDGIQALGLSGGRLCGHGVAIDAAAADAIEGARHAAGLVGPRDAAPGGDARMPRSLDTFRVFEFDDEVVAMVRVSGVSGGFEAVRFSLPDWVALLDRDSAAALPSQAPIAAVQRQPGFRAPAAERIEMPDPQAPGLAIATQVEPPITVIEPAPLASPFDAFAAPAAAPQGFSSLPAFDDPFAANAAPPRQLVLDVGGDDEFAPPVAQPVPEPAAAPAKTAAKPAEEEADLEADLAAAGDDAADFTSFFLPGVGAAAARGASPGGPEIDVEDDPSVMSSDVAFALPSNQPGAPAPAAPPAGVRPRGIKAGAGGAGGEGELQPRARRAPHVEAELDFNFLLKGYCAFVEGNQLVFGRPYGPRVVDRHAYPHHGDPDEAYRAFLQDKIAEGFAPRTELVGDLPRGVTLAPLELDRLARVGRLLT